MPPILFRMVAFVIQNKILDIFLGAMEDGYNVSQRNDDMGRCWVIQTRLFRERMVLDGYTLLGRGAYSTVWADGGRVFKINSGMQGEQDGYLEWVKACRVKAPNNPHAPKAFDATRNGDRYCIELERLQEPDDSDLVEWFGCEEPTGTQIAAYAKRVPAFRELIELAYATAVEFMPECEFPERPGLVKKIECIDIHKARNIMKHPVTGLPVITDPVAYTVSNVGGLAQSMMQCVA